jgi:hypothetical protein
VFVGDVNTLSYQHSGPADRASRVFLAGYASRPFALALGDFFDESLVPECNVEQGRSCAHGFGFMNEIILPFSIRTR